MQGVVVVLVLVRFQPMLFCYLYVALLPVTQELGLFQDRPRDLPFKAICVHEIGAHFGHYALHEKLLESLGACGIENLLFSNDNLHDYLPILERIAIGLQIGPALNFLHIFEIGLIKMPVSEDAGAQALPFPVFQVQDVLVYQGFWSLLMLLLGLSLFVLPQGWIGRNLDLVHSLLLLHRLSHYYTIVIVSIPNIFSHRLSHNDWRLLLLHFMVVMVVVMSLMNWLFYPTHHTGTPSRAHHNLLSPGCADHTGAPWQTYRNLLPSGDTDHASAAYWAHSPHTVPIIVAIVIYYDLLSGTKH